MIELNKRSVATKTVEYRQYIKDDYNSYAIFCENNFGRNAYQIKRSYLEWLYDGTSKGFEVAVYSEKVIGIEHNIKAPVLINNECTMVTVLHDLMVDENHRGTVGFRLMQDSLKRDNYLVLPGSVGRLSRTYGKLGSKKFASFWYRKYQFPLNIFRRISPLKLLSLRKLAERENLLFGHNKEANENFLKNSLKSYKDINQFLVYFKWRFFHKHSPLTFYVSDSDGENSALFVLGKRGKIPYARIFYAQCKSDAIYRKIIKLIEKITSRIGVPVILHTSFECAPPNNFGYRVYADLPVSYVYSSTKKLEFEPIVPSFCSDIGFDGLNLLSDP